MAKSTPASKKESGIALFMVIAAMTILSILVTEFVYIAQVNSRMAYDGLDQLRALYLAKSGFKLSLLRLKAFQEAVKIANGAVPTSTLEKIWSFPFQYPIPQGIPGLTSAQKERIAKFTADSSLVGGFSSSIEPDSAKFNLNRLAIGYAPEPQPSPTPKTGQPQAEPAEITAWQAAVTAFKPDSARKALDAHIQALIDQEMESNEDFAAGYRDFKVVELGDSINAWVNRVFLHPNPPRNDVIPFKQGPFFSVNELHMVPGMDDRLFDLIAPTLTTSLTTGINVNKMSESMLRVLLALGDAPPGVTKEEIEKFFTDRDSDDPDGTFKKPEDFYTYLENFSVLRGNVPAFKTKLENDSLVKILVEESVYKITVQGSANQAVRVLTAYVTVLPAPATPPVVPGHPPPPPPTDSGLKVTFMRIL